MLEDLFDVSQMRDQGVLTAVVVGVGVVVFVVVEIF